MGTVGDDGSSLFGSRTQPKPEITFMFGGQDHRFEPTKEMNSGIEILVDGRAISMRFIPSIGDNLVGFFDTRNSQGKGELLAAFEEGEHVVVQTQGRRSTFDLAQTSEAVAALTRCAAGEQMAQPNVEAVPSAPATASNSPSSGETPASDSQVIGDWLVYASDPYLPSGCLAARSNADGAAFLLHQERPQAGVSFGVSAQGFDLPNGWKGATELVVDGGSIPFSNIRPLDSTTLFSTEAADSTDFVDRMRRGTRAEFAYEGETFRFDLEGFAEAIPAFAECVAANDRTFASALSGNRTNQALGITLAPKVDANDGSLEAADVEEEEAPNEPFDADAVAAFLNQEGAYAQLRCSIPAINLVGLYGADARPIGFDITISDDATAVVQGTSITPVGQRTETGGAGPSVGIYRARDLLGATAQSPLADMFANAPRAPQDAFEEAFLGMITDPGSMVPENRLLRVSLLNNDITVADQLPNGEFGNMTSHRCLRLR